MYIAAGKQKLEEVRNTRLKELMEKAQAGDDQVLAQEAKDLASYCDRFEKKLHASGTESYDLHADSTADPPDSEQ